MGGPRLEEMVAEYSDSRNKIAIVPIDGMITSGTMGRGGYNMVYLIEDQLKMAARDERVKAVILTVNSPGGEVMASDDINNAIAAFQEKTGKPVVACMSSVAASGGYYVSVPCRWIVANELTITGSIGVIMHTYNYRGLMDKIGLRPEVYKSGRFKDMLSPDKRKEDILPEEVTMVQNLIEETFTKFKDVVAKGRAAAASRNQRSPDDKGRELIPTWTEYADGRILSGKQAYNFGFVDELGNLETAVARAKKLAGISDASLVEYQQLFDLSSLFRLLSKSEGGTLKVDWGVDLPNAKAGHMYFLAPSFFH